MKRITLGLIISGLLAPGCEDALAPGQGDINQQPELRRAARRSRDASCGEADAGSSVDALVYVDSGSDSNRRAYNLDAGHDNDASSYDLPGAEVPPESSRLICERASFSLNRISINDGITSI
ncbi:MAG TPA: hypothetical protein VJG49_02910, partial [Candidatus Nanoarchaeia archaeon]|nr:hypothetical protein [Candidatus Nanoarchaeia archaeon]